jgi:hypothetical protein
MPENKNHNLLQRIGKYSESLTPKQDSSWQKFIEQNNPSLAYNTMTQLGILQM